MEKGADGSAFVNPLLVVSHRSAANSEEEAALSTPSNYSSCGSELERYCSANSVLGASSSVCSSVGNHSELLDNFKSLGLVDDFEIFAGREKIHCRNSGRKIDPVNCGFLDSLSDGIIDSPREIGFHESPVFSRTARASRKRITKEFNHIIDDNKRSKGKGIDYIENEGSKTWAQFSEAERKGEFEGVSTYVDAVGSVGVPPSAWQDSKSFLGNHHLCTRDSTPDCSDYLGPSVQDNYAVAKFGHSDCESSIFDSGSDNEDKIHVVKKEEFQKAMNVKAKDDECPSLLNTTVAFGNSDWDDFEQVNGNVDLVSSLFVSGSSVQDEAYHGHVQEVHGMLDAQANGYVDDTGDMQPSCSSHQAHGNKEDVEYYSKKDPPYVDNLRGFEQRASTNILNIKICGTNQNNREDADDIDSQLLHSGMPAAFYSNSGFGGEQSLALMNDTSGEALEVKDIKLKNRENTKANASLLLRKGLDFCSSNEGPAFNEEKKSDAKELYEEMVLDMEEILLDSGESCEGRYMSKHFRHRDGSCTTSTDANENPVLYQPPFTIEGVDVICATQRKGDVSLGERLVGVKEFTVYRLRVWGGKDQWEVERRYREFYSLYQQLKVTFKNHGLSLPYPWSKVERESRKFFGNVSPSVVNERCSLIRDCLHSVLVAKTSFGIPSSLVLFLSPWQNSNHGSESNDLLHSLNILEDGNKSSSCQNLFSQEVTKLGKKISLVVELRVPKSTRLLLEEQRYMCAGCHKHLDTGKSLMQNFVRTIGWQKPQLCEYTGQLFCSSCHTGDAAVLPARVLHKWDFSLYPVSQLAKAYLESIYDKPMLCVSAVNPFLFYRVPALHHIVGVRRKVGTLVSYIRCPFKRHIQRGLGSRRYLLESNDFFALRDLVDLSKGPFSVLTATVETASSKILEHITQQCLICYDIGAPCAAKQACKDPTSAILPFQESEAVRCSLCSALFHEPCIRYLGGCPCSKQVNTSTTKRMVSSKSSTYEDPTELNNMTLQKESKVQATGIFSTLLAKATPEKLWKRKSSSPVILMGSLPSP